MRTVLLVSLSVFLVLASGCLSVGGCDEDQIPSFGLCLDSPADAAPRLDAGAEDAAPPAASFGVACASIEDCGADTDLCATVPGAASGFCTRSGCLADPAICPDGWTCFDASAYVPGVSLCIEQ